MSGEEIGERRTLGNAHLLTKADNMEDAQPCFMKHFGERTLGDQAKVTTVEVVSKRRWELRTMDALCT